MAEPLRIDADEWRAFAAKLKGVEKKTRLQVRRRLRDVAKEIGPEIVREGSAEMPHRGGLDEYVARKGARPTVSQTSTGARLVLGKKSGPQIGRLNAGNLRHPVFAGRNPGKESAVAGRDRRRGLKWVDQSVPAGSWTKAVQARAPKLRKAVAEEITKIMRELD